MKRMKKLLAFLLATMLLLTMIPISASAAPGEIYKGDDLIHYHISDISLQKILENYDYEAEDVDNVKKMSITFKDDYSPRGQDTFVFRYGFTIALSNTSEAIWPTNIDHLTILVDGKAELKVPATDLTWDYQNNPRRYDLRLKNADDTYTVTFYYQKGNEIAQYDDVAGVFAVPAGKTFAEAELTIPEVNLGDYRLVGWEIGSYDGTGVEFSENTVVNSDLSVYARKVSYRGGSQYHVVNEENSIFTAVLDAYNAAHTDAPVEIGALTIDSMYVSNQDGIHTNPDYLKNTSKPNRWHNVNEYFYIANNETGGLEDLTTTNHQIYVDELASLTIRYTIKGSSDYHYLTIDREDLDLRLPKNNDVAVKIYLRSYTDPQPEEPTVPDQPGAGEIVEWAGDGAVRLVCDTDKTHDAKTTKLVADSLTIGKPTLVGEQYTCEVIVDKDSYSYGDGHTLVENQGDGSLLLVYVNDAEKGWKWEISGDQPYVIFHYECKAEEPDDPEEPDAPTEDEIVTNYGDKAVEVVCSTKPVNHVSATYNLTAEAIHVGEPYLNEDTDTYYCDVTIFADSYVRQYKPDGVLHELADKAQNTGIFKLYYDSIKWRLPEGQDKPYVTFDVTCENGGEEPEKPDDPRKEDIVTNYGEEAVNVVCRTEPDNHKSATYNLTAEAIEVGEPYLDEDTDKYYCVVTISADSYVDQYKPGNVPHELADGAPDTGSFKLYHDGIKWLLPKDQDKPYVTFNVTCKDGGDEPEEPGEPTPPTEDDLEDDPEDPSDTAIFKGTPIVVDCITADVNHPNGNYRLLRGTYEIGDVEGNVAEGYTCDITIKAADYIYLYEETYRAHMLENEANKEIVVTLTYDQNKEAWKLPDGFTNVTFRVTCNTTQLPGQDHYIPYPVKPEDPTDPDQTGVADLLETDDHIQYLFGYPDGSFGPDRNMTRAEAAQMFYNLLKNQNVDAEPTFDDVPEGAWYATAVNVMEELGIVNGVGDNKFEPNREITRAEFTTMAMRFAKVPSGGVNIFTDVAPSDWFYSYVVNSIQYGWIEGYGDGTFRPDRLITRAEVTTIVNRMLDRQADMAFVIQNRDKLTKFTDLTTEHWAYYTIVEATNEHDYKKPAIGEDWTSLKK